MDAWLAVIAIVTVATVTPGPNNFLALDAGARGGLRSAVPVIAAVIAGGLALLTLVWAGAGLLFTTEPRLQSALTIAGSAYLAWLGAAMICKAIRSRHATGSPHPGNALPNTWFGVAAFQIINPKAWVLMLTATAALTDTGTISNSGAFVGLAATFASLSASGLTAWALLGSLVGPFVRDNRSRRRLDGTMGALLLGSAVLLIGTA